MRVNFELFTRNHDVICAGCQLVQKLLWVACVIWIPTPRDVDFEEESTTASAVRFGTPLSAQPALMKQLATTALILTSFGLRPRFRTQIWLAFIQTLTIAYTRPLWSAGRCIR